MDSPLCTQRACRVWPSFLHAQEFEANSPPNVQENTSEEPEKDLLKPHATENLVSTAEVLIKKEVVYKEGDRNNWWQKGVNMHPEVVRPAVTVCHCDIGRKECVFSNFDENENVTDEKRTNSVCCVPDDDDDDDKKVEGGGKELFVSGSSYSCSEKKVQHQTCDPGNVVEAEISCDQPTKTSVSSHINFKLKSKESINGQTGTDKVETNRRHVFGYFAGKLSEAYKDAGRRLQTTRDIIRNVQVGEMKVVLSQYVTMMAKELPLIHRMRFEQEPEPCVLAENKVNLVNLVGDRTLSLPQEGGTSAIPASSSWPEGSVSSLKQTSPQVFHQRLVKLPPALSQLQSFSSQKILEKLESLAPQMQVGKLLSVFWLKMANCKQPIPKPGCLLLTEKDIIVVSTGTGSEDTLAIFHSFNLLEIKQVQISLAGQHIRLMSCTEDTILAVFTHSKELTQELCKALLKALAPDKFSAGSERHPLLSNDLMVLSLDWMARVPDIILDNGLHVTSRFKRVLADLLYIVHENMDGPNKPSLADICPLLYTSVKVKNSTHVHQDTIFQFLLTDTHVALLQEDAVFHPVPRGSSLVPVQPQFQGLELRKCSDIRCLLVRQSDNCLVLDIIFTTHKPQTQEEKEESRPVPPTSDHSNPGDQCVSWKLCFGCTSEAVILIDHLCA